MAGLADILSGALGGDALKQIAGHLGTDEAGAQSAVSAALPALLGRLKQNADTPDGAAALANAVNKDHDGSALDNVGGLLSGGASDAGSKIVGKVFGADADAAHAQVAQAAGIDKGKAAGLMAMLAPMVMGALGKSGQGSGGVQAQGLSGMLGGLMGGGGSNPLSSILGGLLGGGGAAAGAAGSALSGAGSAATGMAGGMMGKVTGMLDENKDGSIVDDVTRMAKGGASGGGGILSKIMGMFGKK